MKKSQRKPLNRTNKSITMEDDFFKCQFCSKESDKEEDFQTSADAGDELGDMTCEQCYDDLND